jgi:hypothetical protein
LLFFFLASSSSFPLFQKQKIIMEAKLAEAEVKAVAAVEAAELAGNGFTQDFQIYGVVTAAIVMLLVWIQMSTVTRTGLLEGSFTIPLSLSLSDKI